MTERDRVRRRWRRRSSNDDYICFEQLKNKVQILIWVTKSSFYQETFRTLKELNSIWRKLKHLGLIKSKSLEKKLFFSTEELNELFANNNILTHKDPSNQEIIYFRKECYNDSKFYWRHRITTCDQGINVLSETVSHDDLPPKLLKLTLPSILPTVTHF